MALEFDNSSKISYISWRARIANKTYRKRRTTSTCPKLETHIKVKSESPAMNTSHNQPPPCLHRDQKIADRDRNRRSDSCSCVFGYRGENLMVRLEVFEEVEEMGERSLDPWVGSFSGRRMLRKKSVRRGM
jgi:hypothetical protein